MRLHRYTGYVNRYKRSDKVREGVAAPLQSKRLLDQVRERIGYLHYSLQTEKAYVYRARFFVLWSGSQGGMRHPRDMGVVEVEAFLTMLANERQVPPATHRQALNALLFMYRQVLGMELPWMQQIGRPAERMRLSESTPARERVGPGTGFSLLPLCRWIPRRAWSVAPPVS